MSEQKTIAIIGGGIAGLATAYHLHRDYAVTVFEREPKLGGHTKTHDFKFDDQVVRIESGFIAFSREQYPHFSQIIDSLKIPSKRTSMSFAVSNPNTGIEYNATSVNKLFCQRRNLTNPKFWRMLIDIVRFYRSAKSIINKHEATITVADFLEQENYGEMFGRDHLTPMVSALWSCSPQQVMHYPIQHLVRFLHSHGMMSLWRRPKWEILAKGSDSYVFALQKSLQCEWRLSTAVKSVRRDKSGVFLKTDTGLNLNFDAVVFASHANQALKLLEAPTEDEQNILGAIEFKPNHVTIHTDPSIMPSNENAWGSWNIQVPDNKEHKDQSMCVATYWANHLQGLKIQKNIFTSLNRHQDVDPKLILEECLYFHPVFTPALVQAQQYKNKIDGKNNSFYVGAYWGWGVHEDGARSAYNVSQLIKTQI